MQASPKRGGAPGGGGKNGGVKKMSRARRNFEILVGIEALLGDGSAPANGRRRCAH
jgi:hypothetical protein